MILSAGQVEGVDEFRTFECAEYASPWLRGVNGDLHEIWFLLHSSIVSRT